MKYLVSTLTLMSVVGLVILAAGCPAPASFNLVWGAEGGRNGEFRYPADVASDTSGNVYVADLEIHRIQNFDAAGMVYVADVRNHRIQKFIQ